MENTTPHNHNHSHNHNHAGQADFTRAFAIGVFLNTAYLIIEAIYGIMINSMALLADAGHNLSDVLGLLLAWGAAYLALKQPTQFRTYGFRKTSILAPMFNAILLLIAIGAIGIESIRRLLTPEPVEGYTIIVVAGIGAIVNGVTAFLFMKGREKDINIKGAFLHMAADAGVSVGVVIAGFVILKTHIYWIDSVISLVIMFVILTGTWNLLKDSFNLALDAVPVNIEAAKVAAYLRALPEVKEIHDLHIWAMSATENALTVHIIKNKHTLDDDLTRKICKELNHEYGIDHTTIQYEVGGAGAKL